MLNRIQLLTAPSAYTRLSAAEAIAQLKELFFPGEQLPSVSTMAEVLNGMGYRLRQW